MTSDDADIPREEKIEALRTALQYRPALIGLAIAFSTLAAALEAIGISFILPIVSFIQSDNSEGQNAVLDVFVSTFQFLGVPFTLESVIIGVTVVLAIRYGTTILVAWLREKIRRNYKRHLQNRLFKRSMDAQINYFDEEGGEKILNAIVTEADFGSKVLQYFVRIYQTAILAIAYLVLAFYFSAQLTVFTVIVIGAITVVIRQRMESAYAVGDRVASANERIQQTAQAGIEGIREIKLFTLDDEISETLRDTTEQLAEDSIKVNVNRTVVNNVYQFSMAVFIFVLIYIAITVTSLSFGALGVFLFALFRLAPKLSLLQDQIYGAESDIPHLVRTLRLTDRLELIHETSGTIVSQPNDLTPIQFDDVSFAYQGDENVLDNISFTIEEGEFVAFVGQSGAGKSTIVSLLTRFYRPDEGQILAGGRPASEYELDSWRSRITVVRQSPFIFNESLRYNLTVGNREASQAELDRVCEITHVDEFFDELPEGYDSVLGDDGTQLSGGQKQRIALARALLKDADILLLDEATSDLDSRIQKRVQRSIQSMDEEYTILSISHQLSTVESADRIHIVKDGRIAETGTHETLMSADGEYADLYSMQTNGNY